MCYDVLVLSLLYVGFCNIDSNKLVYIVFVFVILKLKIVFCFQVTFGTLLIFIWTHTITPIGKTVSKFVFGNIAIN